MKRIWVTAMVMWVGCSRSPRPPASAPDGASPSATATAEPSPSASAAAVPEGCAALMEPPPGAELLCSEHVLGNNAEIAWRSYGSTEDRVTVNQRYQAAGPGCQVSRVTKPPLFSIRDGDHHLETYEAGAGGFPTCDKAPAAAHKTVIVISHMMRR